MQPVALWPQKYEVKYEHIHDEANGITADGWMEEENVSSALKHFFAAEDAET